MSLLGCVVVLPFAVGCGERRRTAADGAGRRLMLDWPPCFTLARRSRNASVQLAVCGSGVSRYPGLYTFFQSAFSLFKLTGVKLFAYLNYLNLNKKHAFCRVEEKTAEYRY